jgi:hypothetical protein
MGTERDEARWTSTRIRIIRASATAVLLSEGRGLLFEERRV